MGNIIPILGICDKSYTVQVFLVIKYFIKLTCIIVPLIIMFVTITNLTKVVTNGKDEDLKEAFKTTIKRIIAGLVIFVLPSIIGYAFTNLVKGEGAAFVACIDGATAEKVQDLREKEEKEAEAERKRQEKEDAKVLKEAYDEQHKDDEEKKKIFQEAREKFRDNQDSVSIAGDELFTKQTQRIIDNHKNDFDYSNFKSVLASYGGMQGYVRELGGVFHKYYNVDVPPVTCASDLQEISEYVFGFMYLYGFDYYNGEKYCKWGGSCGGDATTPDAFYPTGVKHTNEGLSGPTSDFDKIVSGAQQVNMTTNCNWTVDMVYYKAGLFGGPGQPGGSASFQSMGSNYQLVTKASQLRVGDIVHFFERDIDRSKPSTWGDWYHVAYIGEVNKSKGYVVGYDGGSYFTNGQNFKWKADIASDTLHGTKNWAAVRIADIKQTC